LKYFISLALFSAIMASANCQDVNTQNSANSPSVIRSTVGMGGSSQTIITEKGTYIVSQSIGQASVIGTFKNNGYTSRQGFQQPFLIAGYGLPVDTNTLEGKLFPNPFMESLNITFDIPIEDELYVYIYDISGNIVYSNINSATQLLSLKLNYLSRGRYIIKVITNKKQFVSNFIKQ